jgi:hypothetical protein
MNDHSNVTTTGVVDVHAANVDTRSGGGGGGGGGQFNDGGDGDAHRFSMTSVVSLTLRLRKYAKKARTASSRVKQKNQDLLLAPVMASPNTKRNSFLLQLGDVSETMAAAAAAAATTTTVATAAAVEDLPQPSLLASLLSSRSASLSTSTSMTLPLPSLLSARSVSLPVSSGLLRSNALYKSASLTIANAVMSDDDNDDDDDDCVTGLQATNAGKPCIFVVRCINFLSRKYIHRLFQQYVEKVDAMVSPPDELCMYVNCVLLPCDDPGAAFARIEGELRRTGPANAHLSRATDAAFRSAVFGDLIDARVATIDITAAGHSKAGLQREPSVATKSSRTWQSPLRRRFATPDKRALLRPADGLLSQQRKLLSRQTTRGSGFRSTAGDDRRSHALSSTTTLRRLDSASRVARDERNLEMTLRLQRRDRYRTREAPERKPIVHSRLRAAIPRTINVDERVLKLSRHATICTGEESMMRLLQQL